MKKKECRGGFGLALFVVCFIALPAIAGAQDQAGGRVDYQVDYFGNDIVGRDVAGGDWAACQKLCLAEPKCVVWTLYTPPPGTVGGCWLKHSKGPTQVSQYAISGSRTAMPSPNGTLVDPFAPLSQRQ